MRSFGEDESHPTIMNFTQLSLLLNLYTPIKTALSGSVEGVPSPILVGVNDKLKETREAYKTKQRSLHIVIEEGLISCLEPSSPPEPTCIYAIGNVVVYYLSGYVIHKVTKGKACDLCIGDVSSNIPVVGSDSYLTEYKSFKRDSIKHTTHKMLGFMKTGNKSVSAFLDHFGFCRDIFWKVLDDLDGCCLPLLGCEKHMLSFTCKVLNFFVALRMHFDATDANCCLENSHKEAVAYKKARLL